MSFDIWKLKSMKISIIGEMQWLSIIRLSIHGAVLIPLCMRSMSKEQEGHGKGSKHNCLVLVVCLQQTQKTILEYLNTVYATHINESISHQNSTCDMFISISTILEAYLLPDVLHPGQLSPPYRRYYRYHRGSRYPLPYCLSGYWLSVYRGQTLPYMYDYHWGHEVQSAEEHRYPALIQPA